MTTAKTILGVIPGLQATALVGRAYKMVPKKWDKPQKKQKSNMMKGFFDITVGVALMKPTAQMINDMK